MFLTPVAGLHKFVGILHSRTPPVCSDQNHIPAGLLQQSSLLTVVLTSNSEALVFCLKPALYCPNCGNFTVCAKAYSVECAVFIFLCAVTTAQFSVQCVSAVYRSD